MKNPAYLSKGQWNISGDNCNFVNNNAWVKFESLEEYQSKPQCAINAVLNTAQLVGMPLSVPNNDIVAISIRCGAEVAQVQNLNFGIGDSYKVFENVFA